jgi:hypothetical protein
MAKPKRAYRRSSGDKFIIPTQELPAFRELKASDAMCRHFARRLAIGEFEMECSPERV